MRGAIPDPREKRMPSSGQQPAFVEAVTPFVPNMVEGIHGAFSLATAQTFWLGVGAGIVSVVAAVAIKEIPLRTSNAAPVPTRAIDDDASAGEGTGTAAAIARSAPSPD